MKRTIVPPNAIPQTAAPTQRVWLLPREGRLYKLNLHAHSTISDGSFAPDRLKQMYMEQGYSGVAFTDHNVCIPHPELTDENFVALTGIEVAFASADESGYIRKMVHINAIARDSGKEMKIPPLPLDYDRINEVVAQLRKENCIVTLNHPVFSDMSTDDLLRIRGVDSIEVYNSIGVMFNNYSDDSAFFEYFLRAGGKADPVAADDCHMHFPDDTPYLEYFQGFTVVKAPELNYDALIEGLDRGACYASTGPMFHNLWLDGDILHVECSPVCSVFVHGKYLSYKAVEAERTDCLTYSQIDISGLRAISPYIWVQLRDTNGRKAWARPYWFGFDSDAMMKRKGDV